MARLAISHHERVGERPHRWLVHLHDRANPVPVELPETERSALDLSDDEIHELLPIAFQRRHDENPDEPFPEADEDDPDDTWDAPVRVYQMHFMG
jgi:hypothetical protein